jgi:hypothetical protein
MPKFVLSGATGLLIKGNIDIDTRSFVAVPVGGGRFASVRAASWRLSQPDLRQHTGLTRVHASVLVPEVIRRGNKWVAVSGRAALDHYFSTGRHLGIFDSDKNAVRYAVRLHNEQAAAAARRRKARTR